MAITVRYGSRLTEAGPGMYAVDPADVPADPGLYVLGTYFGPAPADRTLVGFSWAGIDFTQWGPYYLTKVEGWDSPPGGKAEDRPIVAGHGSLLSPMVRGARSVTIEGFCLGSDRDALFCALGDALAKGFGDGGQSSPLVGDVAGRSLTAGAQLQRFAPSVEQVKWGRNYFGWAIQWRCPDPVRYGPRVLYSAGISNSTSGITLPVTPPWSFPAAPLSGQMVVSNPGNTAAGAVFTLNGPLDSPGLDVAGKRVLYDFNLAEGDSLVIDTAQGGAFLNSEYRSPASRSARTQQLLIPQGVSTVQALGSAGSGGTPWVTASFCPAYW